MRKIKLSRSAVTDEELKTFSETVMCISNSKSINSEPNTIYDFSNLKILIAEDSPDNQTWIRHILNQTKAKIYLASNGGEALAIAMKDSPDLILMDIQMPVMGGYEATEKLRCQGFTKPIIALTAHASKQDREQCLRAGFDEHLSKPVDRFRLMGLIDHYSNNGREKILH